MVLSILIYEENLLRVSYLCFYFSTLLQQEVKDSRLFGPVSMSSIVGRVIYSLRSSVDHGPVDNRFVFFCFHFLTREFIGLCDISQILISLKKFVPFCLPVILAQPKIQLSWNLNWTWKRWPKITKT